MIFIILFFFFRMNERLIVMHKEVHQNHIKLNQIIEKLNAINEKK